MKNQITTENLHDYQGFLDQVTLKIRDSRIRVARSVNKELVSLYWTLGENIVQNQEKYGWGKSIVERLSKDLRAVFGGKFGFSPQNLWYMRQFYLEYKDKPNLQRLVGEIPWSHNLLVMSRVRDDNAKLYYLKAVHTCAWSRDILCIQIKSQAYERQVLAKKQHNFKEALPQHLAEQADKI